MVFLPSMQTILKGRNYFKRNIYTIYFISNVSLKFVKDYPDLYFTIINF